MTELYASHLAELTQRWRNALDATGTDAALISAGRSRTHFLDDHGPRFQPNPHFSQWLPGQPCENAMLLIQPGRRPRLYFHHERDYWHKPPPIPDVGDAFDLQIFGDLDGLTRQVCLDLERINRTALIGESDTADDNLPVAERNPNHLLNRLHFERARKTPFELDCMREASRIGVRGHLAARDAFFAGSSEFEIHNAYLVASEQNESALPYGNIVALNENAGVLHYQHQERRRPSTVNSFLIDAGGSCRGYASDITRTYAARPGTFADLVEALDMAQQSLIADLAPGDDYVDLHAAMHRRIADILSDAGILTTDPERAFEAGITETFLPHGLGHLLGLQVHDVGGQLVSADGGIRPPPANYPALRLTRTLESGHVFTIEPGIYFIPMLLDELRGAPEAGLVDWDLVDELLPYGGIRIEDNVHVQASGSENLTRDAFGATTPAAPTTTWS